MQSRQGPIGPRTRPGACASCCGMPRPSLRMHAMWHARTVKPSLTIALKQLLDACGRLVGSATKHTQTARLVNPKQHSLGLVLLLL